MTENIYILYEKCKINYYNTLKAYNDILDEKEKIFVKVLPRSFDLDKVNVKGGKKSNAFDNYVIELEKKQIDTRLKTIENILLIRKNILVEKEKELRTSKDITDKVYVYKYLDKLKVRKILNLIPYESAQVYRILNKIDKEIKMIKNDKK